MERVSVRALLPPLIAVALVSGCNAVSGVEDLSFGSESRGGSSASAEAGSTAAATGAGAQPGSGGAGGATPQCAASLEDDFQDQTNEPLWNAVATPGSLIDEHDGVVVSEVHGHGDAYYSARAALDVRGCAVRIEVLQTFDPAQPQAGVWFEIGDASASEDYLSFKMFGDTLRAVAVVDGEAQSEFTTPYDPRNHRWWRLREDAGTIYWETSQTGMTWRALHVALSPSFSGKATVSFGGHSRVDDDAAYLGEASFDALQVGPP